MSFVYNLGGQHSHITILHTNDLHAHYQEINIDGKDCTETERTANGCLGGIGRLASMVKQWREKVPDLLLLDAGDQFQGSIFYNVFKGDLVARVMNELRYDLMVLGNHEFDDGPEALADFIEKVNFPVICANCVAEKSPRLNALLKPYHIFPSQHLAVIGYVKNVTGSISNAGPTMAFTDPISTVQKYVNYLRNELGIQRVIALSHNGYVDDLYLASNIRGLDAIVGGHSHTYLTSDKHDQNFKYAKGAYPTIVKDLDDHDVYVVQAWAWGRYLGHIDLSYDSGGGLTRLGGAPKFLDGEIEKDADMEGILSTHSQKIHEIESEVIGYATDAFSHRGCMSHECQIGNLVADAMLAYQEERGAEAAIINTGAIRGELFKGNITMKDIMVMLPFGDNIVQVTMYGQEIRDFVETYLSLRSVASGEKIKGFLQVAGLRITVDKKAAEFNRLYKLEIWNSTQKQYNLVLDRKRYQIVTGNFLANGGDRIIKPIPDVTLIEDISNVLVHYIRSRSPLTPSIDGRIKFLRN
ncbi:Metallo-dependent phosphatase [Basidiobolus meristosporus CBS 931.73]|uniref:Metallo-dependent phosphatase n=1 Tax=Basidiobolus meristosporus CBS 931.73 TaxID=1314790 RepID=A0A1Y1YXK3_9FUNG|nr:Metallo-dependent phosphatase [Basidiobolus meristosporus CBS 931.73]|eukprot:ORY02709.1 Metallo-dependent phosphatase [Basidiobolus meristosporus CBS 931.73]